MVDYSEIYKEFTEGRLRQFYRVMYPVMLNYASEILGNELSYLSEDCVQDAVLTTYMNRQSISTPGEWRSYMLTCLRNRAFDTLRKLDSYRNFVDHEEKRGGIEDDVSLVMIEHETLENLYVAIDSLPEKYREIVTLSFEQGMKNAEVAAHLGLTEIGVKKRKAKMIELLRQRLGRKSADDVIMILMAASMMGHQ